MAPMSRVIKQDISDTTIVRLRPLLLLLDGLCRYCLCGYRDHPCIDLEWTHVDLHWFLTAFAKTATAFTATTFAATASTFDLNAFATTTTACAKTTISFTFTAAETGFAASNCLYLNYLSPQLPFAVAAFHNTFRCNCLLQLLPFDATTFAETTFPTTVDAFSETSTTFA